MMSEDAMYKKKPTASIITSVFSSIRTAEFIASMGQPAANKP